MKFLLKIRDLLAANTITSWMVFFVLKYLMRRPVPEGWLLPQGDVDAWSAKNEELLTQPDQLEKMMASSVKWASRFTFQGSGEGMHKLFRSLSNES